jgi:aspartyl-tRNA(Asn)/glutamyl-tRNA(Gln) amidotransferase subunit A
MTDQLANLGVCEAASAIARGEVSSEKLTQIALDRLQRIGPQLNCVASLQAESALESARRADALQSQGK